MCVQVVEAGEGAGEYTDGIVYSLAHTPGFKDTNAAVLLNIFQVFGALAKASS